MLQNLGQLTRSNDDSGLFLIPTRDNGKPALRRSKVEEQIDTITLKTSGDQHAWLRLSGAIGLALLAITVVPAIAVAQDTRNADGASDVLEEIMVTARRREENLQDVPAAVTAFSGKDLALSGASDITEIAQQAPSVTLEPSRATNSTLTAFIRGIGQQDPLAGFEQGVALYIDESTLPVRRVLLDIYDVERVEVLRGPQGTLYRA